ncbi:MAG TPA: 3-deoxy-7-phosphoheptulonate synthase, partial [Acidimicrobiales bacterium]|nr:3-deoxy-7-phosphoheptulonate synthase [Acidimicrobiales bacterium]
RAELPLSEENEQVVLAGREQASAILDGRDDRMLVIVGPCSVHDPAAAYDYATRLSDVAARTSDRLFIVMRVYFEKPRTTHGWKGLLNDPGLDESFRVNDGLASARWLLLEILSLGMPIACEFLDTITPQYIADAVSWGAIGARTSQSQIHRQLASGLSMPIGFKNSTEGDAQGAVDAIVAASKSQVFPGITHDGRAAIFTTSGNPDCHVVLRGATSGPNYDEASVAQTLDRLEQKGLERRVVIDASHGNSGKDHLRQPLVVADIARRVADGEQGIVGMMLESFLVAGRQDLEFGRARELVYGKSITDACMGWDTTANVLETLADAVVARRSLVKT